MLIWWHEQSTWCKSKYSLIWIMTWFNHVFSNQLKLFLLDIYKLMKSHIHNQSNIYNSSKPYKFTENILTYQNMIYKYSLVIKPVNHTQFYFILNITPGHESGLTYHITPCLITCCIQIQFITTFKDSTVIFSFKTCSHSMITYFTHLV